VLENGVEYRELLVGFGYKRIQLKKKPRNYRLQYSGDNINAKKPQKLE